MSTDEPHWLDDDEMAAWLPLLAVINLLPQALDQQLRTEAGISHVYYSMLVTLAQQPDRSLPMGELARLSFTSPSRLTHAIAKLEERGWVQRNPCPTNRRIQFATLTDNGADLLDRVAPGHVSQVRQRVFDRLSTEQVAALQDIAATLRSGLDDVNV